MQAMESAFDVCTEDLFNQTVKLEEMEKKAGNAESEVSALRGRNILLQENNEKQEERLAKATLELAGACIRADQSVRKRTELENAVSSNEESTDNLDKQLSESKVTLADSESVTFDSLSCLSRLSVDSSLEETAFSNSVLFLTLWSALMHAPASSRVALASLSSCFSLFSWRRIFLPRKAETSLSALPAFFSISSSFTV